MELEYTNTNSRRAKLYIAVGLVLAVIVAGVVYVALQFSGLTGAREQAEMRTVVVAVRDIASRKPIEEGDVTTRTVPLDPTNATAFAEVADVLGRVSGISIAAGQLVTQNMLASSTSGQAFSIIEPGQAYDPEGPDLRAVSLSVPDDRAVAGTLVAGQRVDLIVTMAINPEIGQTPEEAAETTRQFLPGPSTKVTLQALTILARNGALYILRTDLATAEKIAELTAAGGQFTFVLRADPDDRVAETEGSTLDRLLEEFDFPVPLPPEFDDDASAAP